jgi:uncharacterized tellurite resistance protein B-like protein
MTAMAKTAATLAPESALERRIGELRSDYARRIAELQRRGDLEGVMKASAELERRLAALNEEYTQAALSALAAGPPGLPDDLPDPLEDGEDSVPAPVIPLHGLLPPAAPAGGIYDGGLCRLDLDRTACDGDRGTLAGLLADPAFVQAADALLRDDPGLSARRELLNRCLKLTPGTAPKLHAVGQRCREALGLVPPLEFHVYPDAQLSAAAYRPGRDRLCILLTSALLGSFDEDELCFAIGHQIGHALFDHRQFPIDVLLQRGRGVITPAHALRIHAWKRHAEISADRVGLLCNRDLEAAGRALFKFSSGIVTGAPALWTAPSTDPPLDSEDGYSTQPFNPLRIRALQIFQESPENVEAAIRSLLAPVEPACLSRTGEPGRRMRELVFLGSCLVAQAGGAVGRAELGALSGILDTDAADAEERLARVASATPDALWKDLGRMAETLRAGLPATSMLNLVQSLSVIACSTGHVGEVQRRALDRLCRLLGVQPEFADRLQYQAAQGLD